MELLEILESDRAEICGMVSRKTDYYIVLVARSHEDIYDFPMIDVYMADRADRRPVAGPVFFYWKRSGSWSELNEMSRWWEDPGVD